MLHLWVLAQEKPGRTRPTEIPGPHWNTRRQPGRLGCHSRTSPSMDPLARKSEALHPSDSTSCSISGYQISGFAARAATAHVAALRQLLLDHLPCSANWLPTPAAVSCRMCSARVGQAIERIAEEISTPEQRGVRSGCKTTLEHLQRRDMLTHLLMAVPLLHRRRLEDGHRVHGRHQRAPCYRRPAVCLRHSMMRRA